MGPLLIQVRLQPFELLLELVEDLFVLLSLVLHFGVCLADFFLHEAELLEVGFLPVFHSVV